MPRPVPGDPTVPLRRRRYAGTHPRGFHDKYKELDPERYPHTIARVRAAGRTPAGTHVPIMVAEVLEALAPRPGEVAVDCTLGGGGHAAAILARLQPRGRLIGLDVDPIELPRTEARLRTAGYGAESFAACRSTFAALAQVLVAQGIVGADIVLADLGVSSMQLDDPARGFGYKVAGPLDMRMNPTRGEPASALLGRLSEAALADVLSEYADEPEAAIIAKLLKEQVPVTTDAAERAVRRGLNRLRPDLGRADVKASVRRTFQALRIAVNDELAALDEFLRVVPACLAPGGRVAVISFHSGEDRRVKKAFKAGLQDGTYAAVAADVIRPSMEETRANRRASSAKLRWAVRTPSIDQNR